MQSAHLVANPFALLLNPAEVVAEMERSERLNRLASRICRPLDRVQPGSGSADAAADDADLIVSSEDAATRIG
ncbi:MAG: hypothetical protein QM722_13750 [Piscinibacter sp.]